jgi:RNA-binding protein 39
MSAIPATATAGDIEALLDGVQREVEETRKLERGAGDAREHDARRDDRPRDRPHGRRDRSRDRPRGHRQYSRDRDLQRRDGSRPRSSKGADTDEEPHRDSYRNDRGGPRRSRADGGDYYNGGGRPRSRSPRRDRDDRNRGVRDRSRDRRGGGHGDHRNTRRSKTASPEATEESKDKRTIFVQQISQRAETRHLRVFFEAVGPVADAQIVKDRVTGRSKGHVMSFQIIDENCANSHLRVGYVEFKDEESVPKALELTGQKLKGVPIIAQLAEAEKNRAARPSEGGVAPGANGAPFHRLYVGNIHFSVSEVDLKEIFEPYGELEQVILQRDEAIPGRSKGYGFVQ